MFSIPSLVPYTPTSNSAFCVIRFHLLVRDGPIHAEPVARARFEIVRTVSECDATPVISATPEHARPPPLKLLVRFSRSVGVRLSGHFPTTPDGCVEKSERLVRRGGAHQRRFALGLKHRGFAGRIVVAARL